MTNETQNEEARLRAMIADWSSALSRKDSAGALKHYAREAVQYSLAPPLKYELLSAEQLEDWFATWDGQIRYEAADLAVHIGGDVAFVHGLVHMWGTKLDGEKPDLWFRLTLGLRERRGEWMIVLEHESVPFYMDGSYRAAVDLKPDGR